MSRAGEAVTPCTLSMATCQTVLSGSDPDKCYPSLCHSCVANGQCHPQKRRAVLSQGRKGTAACCQEEGAEFEPCTEVPA